MKPSITTNLAVTLLGAILASHACGGSGKSTSHDSADAAPGSSGGLATGGNSTPTGGSPMGGIMSSGGDPVTGGSPGTGGSAIGGSPGTGGSAIGGGPGTGGTRAPGGSGGSNSSGADAGTACSCAGGKTSLECFCEVYACTDTLASYTPDAGTGLAYSSLEEYAGCNLIVITIVDIVGPQLHVFDRATGQLVGRRLNSDVVENCPFGGASAGFSLTAGTLPDSTCVRTKCVKGSQPEFVSCP